MLCSCIFVRANLTHNPYTTQCLTHYFGFGLTHTRTHMLYLLCMYTFIPYIYIYIYISIFSDLEPSVKVIDMHIFCVTVKPYHG